MKTKTNCENRICLSAKKLPLWQVGVMLLCLTAAHGLAQPSTILHAFTSSTNGYYPSAGLLVSGGVIFGAANGGASDRGFIYRLNTNGTDYTIIKEFTGSDGAYPRGGLLQSGSTIYGTTSWGGSSNKGTVFQMNPAGTGHLVLKHFTGSDGNGPNGILLLSGGTLYGTTEGGGSSNKGTIFRLNTDGSGFTVLKHFAGSDGASPVEGLALSGATLYGGTSYSTPAGGTVFKVNTDGSGFAVLKQLATCWSYKGLALEGTNLYFTAYCYNGSGSETGAVFRLSTDGSSFAMLQSLTYTWPNYNLGGMSGPVLSGSMLYGTTAGSDPHERGYNGSVFRLKTDGSDYAVLQRFDFTNGSIPGRLTLADGTLYGTTTYGGTSTPRTIGYGVVFSSPTNPLIIVLQPLSQTVPPGASVEFQVAATGEPPLAYQWFFNGTNAIEAATSPQLILTNVQFSHAGDYTVVVTNATASVTSLVATLQVVIVPPFIITEPTNYSADFHTSAQFAVAAGGSPPLSYQWFKGTTSLSNAGNISGAQTPILTLTNVIIEDAGGYSAIVSNAYGCVTSVVATLQVNFVPPFITNQPISVATNYGATAQFGVMAGGLPPLSYQWFKGETSLSDGGNISGAQTPMLRLANVAGGDRGGYTVKVTNLCGSVTSSVTTLSVTDPWIAAQPVSQTAIRGQSVVLSAGVIGTPPLTYQWRKDSVNLTGQTNSSLAFASAQSADAGNYDVLVNGLYGTTPSTLAALTVASQRAGDVDFSFDPGSTLNGIVRAIGVQADGKVVIGGDFTTVHGVVRGGIARLNADGTTDDSFLAGLAGANSSVSCLAIQPDGKIVIGGEFTTVNGVARTNVARLNVNGSLDSSFVANTSGGYRSGSSSVSWLAVQSDGKIVMAGAFTNVNGVAKSCLARLNSDGSLDPSYAGSASSGTFPTLGAFAMQPDGKVVIGGYFTNVSGGAQTNLARLNTNGTVDASFVPSSQVRNALRSSAEFLSLAVQSDGKLLFGGYFRSSPPSVTRTLLRINSDGSLDTGFLTGLTGPDNRVHALALQPDGKILIGGSYFSVNGTPRSNLARLHADGALDTSFVPVTLSGIDALALQSDGKVVVACDPSGENFYLPRLNTDGSLDPTFDNGPRGPDWGLTCVDVQADGKVLIGGQFRAISGVWRSYLARLNADGSLDSAFLDGLAGPNYSVKGILCQTNGKILIRGVFDTVNAVSQARLARLNADGTLDNSFLPTVDGDINAFLLQNDGKIVLAGSFRTVNGVARNCLARLYPDGSLESAFPVNLPGAGYSTALALQRDGKILIAGYNGWYPGNHLTRVQADGAVDQSFSCPPSHDSLIRVLALQSDGRILLANDLNNLIRVLPDGALDTSFGAAPHGTISALAVQHDDKIIFGGSASGTSKPGFGRLNPGGSTDDSFLAGQAGPNGAVNCLLIQSDRRMLLGGWFTAVNQAARGYVARLLGEALAPDLVVTPQPQTAESGATVRFQVQGSGFPPPTYQWFFNGTNLLADANNNVLQLTGVQPLQSGAYTVVLSNIAGAVTSAPVLLNVIAPVERKTGSVLQLQGEAGSDLNLDYTAVLGPMADWQPLGTVSLTGTSGSYSDLPLPFPPQRYYRVWQSGAPAIVPSLKVAVVAPALTLTGSISSQVRVDGINAIGPTDAWFTLATVTLTNTPQLYFDASATGQPRRLYRLVPLP